MIKLDVQVIKCLFAELEIRKMYKRDYDVNG
jgi:hypothetical protein